MIVRHGEDRDVDSLFELEQVCFSDPWSRESLSYDINENEKAIYVVCEKDEKVIGYAGIWQILDEGHITNVAVSPNFRRTGVAKAMLIELMALSRKKGITKFTLEVRISNANAIKLYEDFGFRSVGIRKKYYLNNGEDAIIMWL